MPTVIVIADSSSSGLSPCQNSSSAGAMPGAMSATLLSAIGFRYATVGPSSSPAAAGTAAGARNCHAGS